MIVEMLFSWLGTSGACMPVGSVVSWLFMCYVVFWYDFGDTLWCHNFLVVSDWKDYGPYMAIGYC